MTSRQQIWLDKAERNLLAKIKAVSPQYADLEVSDIAHLELKNRLTEVLRQNLNNQRHTTLQHAPVV